MKLYPELADKAPRREPLDREPYHSVLFEALALADQAINEGANQSVLRMTNGNG